MEPEVWIAVIQLVITTLLSGAVGYVAFRQWQTAREKLAIDLFDRRLAAYRTLRDALESRDAELARFEISGGKATLTYAGNRQIARAVDEVGFLFGDEVAPLLKVLSAAKFSEAQALKRYHRLKAKGGQASEDACDRHIEAMGASDDAMNALIIALDPFLKLGHLGVPRSKSKRERDLSRK